MQYRAAIFDIDGTLVHKGEKAPSAALQNAIMRLQAQGVTVIIATGRAHFSARAVLGATGNVMGLRGTWQDWRLHEGAVSAPALVTLNPAFLLKQPQAKAMAWADMLALAGRFALVLATDYALLLAGVVAAGNVAYGISHVLIHVHRFKSVRMQRWVAFHEVHHRHANKNFVVVPRLAAKGFQKDDVIAGVMTQASTVKPMAPVSSGVKAHRGSSFYRRLQNLQADQPEHPQQYQS